MFPAGVVGGGRSSEPLVASKSAVADGTPVFHILTIAHAERHPSAQTKSEKRQNNQSNLVHVYFVSLNYPTKHITPAATHVIVPILEWVRVVI